MVTIFKQVLAKHEVPAKETQKLLEIIDSTKAEIVVSRQKWDCWPPVGGMFVKEIRFFMI